MFLNLEGFFYVLFSGSYLSAHTKQNLSKHSISENGRKPVKKISAYATALPALNVEVQSPYNRINISHNRNRRFYRWTNDIAEYLEDMADRERQTEVGTVAELLDEIESENLYQVLVAVDGRTLKIVLLKMQGYSTKEIAPLVHLTTGAIYARLDHLRKKLRKFYSV